MDSDDEDILQYEQEKRMGWDKSYIKRYKGDFPTRLYEREEQGWVSVTCDGDMSRLRTYKAIDDIPWDGGRGPTYRVSRFCDTIKGFHVGSLDLAGRHEHRYLSIRKRWDTFVGEFAELLNHTTGSQAVHPDHPDQLLYFGPGQLTVITVEPHSLLEEFQEKWQIRVHETRSLRRIIEEVQECLTRNPFPKLQVMSLLDLPTELLCEITASAGVSGARTLGAACQRLRTISLPYIFKTRKLELKVKNSLFKTGADYELDETRRVMRNFATEARESLFQEIDFLLSREDITTSVEVLTVSIWDSNWFDDSPEHNVLDFLLPVSTRLQQVVTRMPNLRELVLIGVAITKDLKRTFLALPNLFRLELLMCRFTEVSNGDVTVVPSSLLNLSVMIDHDESDQTPSVWTIMPWLTNLRWLSLASTRGATSLLPSLESPEHQNLFTKLETVSIKDMEPWECPDLIEMLNHAANRTEGGLPLTRLKLTFTYGISDFVLVNLLSSLESSSLQYFILDGLNEAMPDIIEDIARTFPNLQSLTLAYRDSYRQCKCAQVVWPFATWEYAQEFARFNCLIHFGWNLETDVTYSPIVMQWFEDGYPEDWWKYNTDPYFETSSDVVKLFASYCPSLRSMTFLINGAPFLNYFIHREANSQISVTEAPSLSPEIDAHNPFAFNKGWPMIHPK